jgi:MerR family transcriptional regulator, mercuric resistance operon regulatory protein
MAALTIGKLAEQSGVHIETVRYYEKIGLMPRPSRTPAGYRNYEPAHVRRLSFIRRSRELGFTLEEIRGLLKLVDGHRYTCAQIQKITVAHIADIRNKIAALRRLERVLASMAAECKGGQIPGCPIIETLFESPAGRPMSHT